MSIDQPSVVARLEEIAQRLKSTTLGELHPFGGEAHRFEFGSQRTEAEICQFEADHAIQLPAEYRLFLQYVGDGGAGPAYGLLSLAQACAQDGNTVANSLLSEPFPHTEPYRPEEDPLFQDIYDPASRSRCTLSTADLHQHYRKLVAGTLPICHEGCGYYHRLVITGPTRGEMWMDARVVDAGFHPLHVTFLEWYVRWYDDTLKGNDGVWWMRDDA